MKKESGLGVVGIIIITCFIIAVAFGIYYLANRKRTDEKNETIKSNMLLIQGASKVLYDDCVMKKTTDKLLGTKLSEIDKNNSINKDIIEEFKSKKIINEDKYDKYYVMTDDYLSKLNIEVKNEQDSYYIVGYEDEEVIITKGYNNLFKLSDINKESIESDDLENNKENKDNKENKNDTEKKDEENKEENKEE